MILAGPGSGKTFTTVERVRYLMEVHQADPSGILVITFTKAAARQMRDRFFARMGNSFYPVAFGTFHAVFLQILKASGRYRPDCILREAQKREYLRAALQSMEYRADGRELSGDGDWENGLLSEIGYLKNLGRVPEDFKSAFLEQADFQKVFIAFERLLFQEGKLDLDDFAAAVLHLFRRDPETLAQWRKRFSYIMVDEFQDVNAVQYEAIKLLAGEDKNLFVVGDDDQAIYGFRGSDPSIMRRFAQDFPEAERISLSVNYRSRPGIVETAGRLVSVNRERFPKKIEAGRSAEASPDPAGRPGAVGMPGVAGMSGVAGRPELWRPLAADQSVLVGRFETRRKEAQALAALLGRLYQQCREAGSVLSAAAIFRTNGEAIWLAEALGEAKIPFVMKEKPQNPYSHPVCRDLLAYLRFAKAGRQRKDFFAIMNRPCRYLSRQLVGEGPVSLGALAMACRDRPYLRQNIEKLQADIGRIARMDLYAAVNYIRKGAGYDCWIRKELAGEKAREATEKADFFQRSMKEFHSLEQLEAHLEAYGRTEGGAREKAPLAAAGPEAETVTETEGGAVELITMHGAKGLEYDTVFLPGCCEGTVPHKKSAQAGCLEEERRMFYVGMTRARERLYLSWVSGTKEEPGFPSRFLAECGYRE